jgi:hypothetical protein
MQFAFIAVISLLSDKWPKANKIPKSMDIGIAKGRMAGYIKINNFKMVPIATPLDKIRLAISKIRSSKSNRENIAMPKRKEERNSFKI